MTHPLAHLPSVIGHRGACGSAPENTLASLLVADRGGVSMVELDVTVTADGVPVVMHDFDLDRCSNGVGPVVLQPLSLVKSLDAGSWFSPAFKGEGIPTLEEALEVIFATGMALNLEIKPTLGWDEPTAEAVVDVIKSAWPQGHLLLLSSMSERALSVAHEALPDIPRGLITYAIPTDWQLRLNAFNCASLHCAFPFVTQDIAQALHNDGRKLLTYTVNDKDRAKELLSLGADAIFTDHPAQLQGL